MALRIEPMPDTPMQRRMAEGHSRRTGHLADFRHVTTDGTLWHTVRLCCGDTFPELVPTWEDLTPQKASTS